jgi:hypothetical protein
MDVTKLPEGKIALSLDLNELSVIGQCLNECLYGFGLPDFERRIGISEQPRSQ